MGVWKMKRIQALKEKIKRQLLLNFLLTGNLESLFLIKRL